MNTLAAPSELVGTVLVIGRRRLGILRVCMIIKAVAFQAAITIVVRNWGLSGQIIEVWVVLAVTFVWEYIQIAGNKLMKS
jgi:hypothetical protein